MDSPEEFDVLGEASLGCGFARIQLTYQLRRSFGVRISKKAKYNEDRRGAQHPPTWGQIADRNPQGDQKECTRDRFLGGHKKGSGKA
jgi:hypothetical protein